MRALVLAVATLGLVAFTGAAYAGGGCSGSKSHEQTAEVPPPPPPSPST